MTPPAVIRRPRVVRAEARPASAGEAITAERPRVLPWAEQVGRFTWGEFRRYGAVPERRRGA